MKLIDDLDTLYKRWSTRIAGIQLSSVIAYWALVPAEWKAAVPNWVLLSLMAFFAAGFIGAQTVKQTKLDISTKDGG